MLKKPIRTKFPITIQVITIVKFNYRYKIYQSRGYGNRTNCVMQKGLRKDEIQTLDVFSTNTPLPVAILLKHFDQTDMVWDIRMPSNHTND